MLICGTCGATYDRNNIIRDDFCPRSDCDGLLIDTDSTITPIIQEFIKNDVEIIDFDAGKHASYECYGVMHISFGLTKSGIRIDAALRDTLTHMHTTAIKNHSAIENYLWANDLAPIYDPFYDKYTIKMTYQDYTDWLLCVRIFNEIAHRIDPAYQSEYGDKQRQISCKYYNTEGNSQSDILDYFYSEFTRDIADTDINSMARLEICVTTTNQKFPGPEWRIRYNSLISCKGKYAYEPQYSYGFQPYAKFDYNAQINREDFPAFSHGFNDLEEIKEMLGIEE